MTGAQWHRQCACTMRVQHCPSIRSPAFTVTPISSAQFLEPGSWRRSTMHRPQRNLHTKGYRVHMRNCRYYPWTIGCWRNATFVSKHSSSKEPMLALNTRILKAGNQLGRQSR